MAWLTRKRMSRKEDRIPNLVLFPSDIFIFTVCLLPKGKKKLIIGVELGLFQVHVVILSVTTRCHLRTMIPYHRHHGGAPANGKKP